MERGRCWVLCLLVFAPFLASSVSAFLTSPNTLHPSVSTRKACQSKPGSPCVSIRRHRFFETITASSLSRRDALVVVLATTPIIAPMQSLVAAEEEAGKGEQAAAGIRKMASKLPGMGPSDVVYPDGMAGRWKVEKTLAGVDFPAGEGAADPATAKKALERLNKATTFSMRFIRSGESVVADREFNTQQEIAATEGQEARVVWKVTNPNVLTVTYPSGEVLERKVTRRSASGGGAEEGMEFSEYSRVARVGAGGVGGGVPELGARWVRGKFKLLPAPTQAEGLVLEYLLPPQSSHPADATLKLKYRLRLQKDHRPAPP